MWEIDVDYNDIYEQMIYSMHVISTHIETIFSIVENSISMAIHIMTMIKFKHAT